MQAGDQLSTFDPRTVCAVVVTYRPELAQLRETLRLLAPQVGQVVVVDNASGGGFDAFAADATAAGCIVLQNHENLGLAAGFNRGIAHAKAGGFGFVLLMDQDSLPEPSMVSTLLAAYMRLSAMQQVAAVGAQFVDSRDGSVAPFVRVGFPFNRKIPGAPGQYVACDFLISSGCLLPIPVLDVVGPMDASLFIDSVDLDWCFRARDLGYTLHGVCDARMRHAIGDELRPSRLMGRGMFIHSPARLYYLMRNRLLLYRRRHTPRVWIAQDMLRFVGKFLRMSLLVAPRAANARAMLRGAWDGLRGRAGASG
ncbi:MAG: glycosyltransferase family 2 protein [Thermomonas sp.]|uniref:glycosyltransferase family 2 protein n=1 Tax=Thermomonas sp. TaxID=1971895 RepID=UPI0039E4CCE7